MESFCHAVAVWVFSAVGLLWSHNSWPEVALLMWPKGEVIGSILPSIITGNSFPRSAYLLSACYQDADLTTRSLVKQRKNSCCKTVGISIFRLYQKLTSEISLLLCPFFAVCLPQDHITKWTKFWRAFESEDETEPGFSCTHTTSDSSGQTRTSLQ